MCRNKGGFPFGYSSITIFSGSGKRRKHHKGRPESSKKHPLIHYHIYSGDTERVMEKLDKGLIDFGLLVGQVDISKYDYIRFPVKDTWGVLMCKDSPLAQKESVSPEDLWDKPLIISHQTWINNEMFHWLQAELNAVH